MLLKSVHVKNFRSILCETLSCENLTVLVGPNNSGKSSFLHAIELFQNKSAKIDKEDYYDGDTKKNIEITITFKNLSNLAIEQFTKYVHQNDHQENELVVRRIFAWDDNTSNFHGFTFRNTDFDSVRSSTASDAKKKYFLLKKQSKYMEFPNWSSHSKVKTFLTEWENKHPETCKMLLDSELFFGFTEGKPGFLGDYVKFLYIPAVHNANEDAQEGRGSILTDLMEEVIRKNFAEWKETKKFHANTNLIYEKFINNSKLRLGTLNKELNQTLSRFIYDAKIDLSWQPPDFEILPRAIANLISDGYTSPVDKVGHGLQRAFIITMLEQLSINQITNAHEIQPLNKFPTLIFLIEEPELYQHPNTQRHMAQMFLSLVCKKIPTRGKIQIIHSTHSSYFVGIDRLDEIRLLRKIFTTNETPQETKIYHICMQDIVEELSSITRNYTFTISGMISRLQSIMTPWMNEGFFARFIVLVEGVWDRAAIIETAKNMDYEFENLGISIIPCSGKTNLDRPYLIFQKLGIPTYVVWDGDKNTKGNKGKKNARTFNRYLLSLLKETKKDWPNGTKKKFACFENTLYDTIKKEIPDGIFENYVIEYGNAVGMDKDSAEHNPYIISQVIKKLKRNNHTSPTLKKIVNQIIKLRNSNY